LLFFFLDLKSSISISNLFSSSLSILAFLSYKSSWSVIMAMQFCMYSFLLFRSWSLSPFLHLRSSSFVYNMRLLGKSCIIMEVFRCMFSLGRDRPCLPHEILKCIICLSHYAIHSCRAMILMTYILKTM
jgi:hypothetical protein